MFYILINKKKNYVTSCSERCYKSDTKAKMKTIFSHPLNKIVMSCVYLRALCLVSGLFFLKVWAKSQVIGLVVKTYHDLKSNPTSRNLIGLCDLKG